MTPANKEYFDLVAGICGGNEHALRWFTQLIEVVSAWDHIVDNDPITRKEVDDAFMFMCLEWGVNKFWLQYSTMMVPVCAAAISAWKWSNHHTSPKLKAYDVYTEVPAAMAFLLGGMDRVNRFMPEIRGLVMTMMEEDEHRDNGAK